MRPCSHAREPAYLHAKECRVCWWYAHDPAHKAVWDGPPVEVKRVRPCKHLGAATGDTRECKTCGGTKTIPLYHCGIHGVCTKDGMPDRTMNCGVCQHTNAGYEPS